MIPVETVPGIGGGGMKTKVEEVNLLTIYLIIVRTCVNATMNPHLSQE
jgi:hypothetical protein